MALTTVPASLSATALTLTTAAQPNITSVGTLTGLTVSGNIAGTLTTAAQTNITSVGTLSSLTVSGALNGTLSTAAQTNITSVGTLTGLDIGSNSHTGANPAFGLTVDGANDYIAQFANTDATAGENHGVRILAGSNANDIAFQIKNKDNNAHFMNIDGAGKVGIGTNTPSALTHVYNGTLQVGSKTGDTSIQQNTTAIRIAAVPNSSTEWGGLQWYREFSDVIGAEIIAARPSSAEADTDLIFKTSTNSSNAVEAMRIDHNGKVGIGTTAMSSYYSKNLVVLTDGDGTGGLTLVSPATDDNAYLCFADGTSGAATYAGYLGYDHNNDKAFIGVGGATQLTILSDGKTAIGGNHTPSAPLDIQTAGNTADGTYFSTITINNTGSSTYSRLRFDRSGSERWGVGLRNDDKFQIAKFFNTASDDTFVIDSSGNIGIGTGSPTANLTITDENAGQATIQARNFATSATGSFGNAHAFEFRAATSTTTHGMLVALNENHSTRRSLEVADSTGIFATFVNGRLGIGRNNPSARLHIQSTGSTTYSGSSAGSNIGLYLTNSESGAAGRTIGIGLTCESNAEVYLNAVTESGNNGGDFTIASRNAGTRAEKMRVHAAGSVTKPLNPSFQARYPAQTNGGGATIVFSGTHHNIGSHYNTSNGIFTAPVAGSYLFTFQILMYPTGANHYARVLFAKNGTTVDHTLGDTLESADYDVQQDYQTQGMSMVIYLNANDTIRLRNEGQSRTYGTGYGAFSGCLLG